MSLLVLFFGDIVIVSIVILKQEALFTSVSECESYIAWKREKGNQRFSWIDRGSFYLKKNPVVPDGKPLKFQVCQLIGHFVKTVHRYTEIIK